MQELIEFLWKLVGGRKNGLTMATVVFLLVMIYEGNLAPELIKLALIIIGALVALNGLWNILQKIYATNGGEKGEATISRLIDSTPVSGPGDGGN